MSPATRSHPERPIAAVDRQSVGTPSGVRPADVPRRLWRDPHVTHSGDAGGFYCEHAFFTAQTVAATAAVRQNRHGERLVGFLHVPGAQDRWMTALHPPDPAKRHGRTRLVVGRALAGFTTDVLAGGIGPEEPIRLLLTGFGPWGAVLDNPTGDFVANPENLQAALALGFADRLASRPLVTVAEAEPWRLEVAVHASLPDGPRQVIVCGWQLPTSDEALDQEAPRSLPVAIRGSFQPHAVVSLGVARRRRRFYVEHTADDENLVDGCHRPNPAGTAHAVNFALARAIHQGLTC